MNLNKVIRKQKASINRFMFSMCLIFFSLPVALIISHQYNIFLILYLVLIEMLIILAVLARLNKDFLNFKCDGYKFKVKDGIFKSYCVIMCDKISMVHAQSKDKEMKLIVISKTKFRNKYLRIVNDNFIKRYPYLGYQYKRLKKLYPENQYYYIVFRNGGYKKYLLLEEMFKKCVHANFTDKAMEQLKCIEKN